jgi:hypothetical protein
MTDNERLERIKKLWEWDYPLTETEEGQLGRDFDWLIKQAERVQELEQEVNDWRAEVQKWQKFYKESEESHSETKELLYSTISENKRYKQALEFYADEETYETKFARKALG